MERFITHIDYEVLLTRIDGLMRKGENNITSEECDQLKAMVLTAREYETRTYLSAKRSIKPQIYNELRDEAAHVYSTEKAIRSVVVSVGMRAGEIEMQGAAKHIWDSFLNVAVYHQKLSEVLLYIATEFPTNTIFANTLAAVKDESAFVNAENLQFIKPNNESAQSGTTYDSSLFRQFFDDHFNNLKNIVNDLKGQISDAMRADADILAKICNQSNGDATNFFELLYRMLHLEYKCQSNSRDFRLVNLFFHKWNWRIGNYIASYIYLVKLIHEKCQSDSEKNSYITMLLHSSTNDERRLLFYYVVSRNDVEKEELVSLFCRFRFFDSLRIPSLPLIYPEDWDELNA